MAATNKPLPESNNQGTKTNEDLTTGFSLTPGVDLTGKLTKDKNGWSPKPKPS